MNNGKRKADHNSIASDKITTGTTDSDSAFTEKGHLEQLYHFLITMMTSDRRFITFRDLVRLLDKGKTIIDIRASALINRSSRSSVKRFSDYVTEMRSVGDVGLEKEFENVGLSEDLAKDSITLYDAAYDFITKAQGAIKKRLDQLGYGICLEMPLVYYKHYYNKLDDAAISKLEAVSVFPIKLEILHFCVPYLIIQTIQKLVLKWMRLLPITDMQSKIT
jgi:hypothetical protein